jgi:hypothetical protein
VNGAIADLMGIRWVLSRGVQIETPGFVEVFARGDERVYENREVFARAFLASGSRSFDSVPALLDALGHAGTAELRNTAYIEQAGGAGTAVRHGPVAGEALIDEYSPDHVVIGTSAAAPATVVLTDAYSPGWSASVDGVPASLFPVYRAFRGVRVPAGRHRVEMSYRPAAARRGALLLLLATLGTIGWAIVARARSPGPATVGPA